MSDENYTPTAPKSGQDAADYFRQTLKDRVASFQSSVIWYRRSHLITQMSTVILSAAVTVAAGLRGSWGNADLTNNTVMVLSAVTTIVAAWVAIFSPRDSWHLYAETLNKMRALQSRFNFQNAFNQSVPSDDTFCKAFFAEYQEILESHNARWAEIRKK